MKEDRKNSLRAKICIRNGSERLACRPAYTERERNSIALLAECDREGEGLEADRENEKEGRSDVLSYMILSE